MSEGPAGRYCAKPKSSPGPPKYIYEVKARSERQPGENKTPDVDVQSPDCRAVRSDAVLREGIQTTGRS